MKTYRPHQFGELIGVSTSTLRLWDRNGKLPARRNTSNQRYYTDEDIWRIQGKKPNQQKVIVYCRVSSQGQKSDLQHQQEAMAQFCLGAGLAVDEWISEIGSGLNFKRPKFLHLMQEIELGLVKTVVIAHKDRFVRFGFDFFQDFAERHHCEFIVANQEKLSPEKEMVEDMLAVVHSFSSRLYGLRKYNKQIKSYLNESQS